MAQSSLNTKLISLNLYQVRLVDDGSNVPPCYVAARSKDKAREVYLHHFVFDRNIDIEFIARLRPFLIEMSIDA